MSLIRGEFMPPISSTATVAPAPFAIPDAVASAAAVAFIVTAGLESCDIRGVWPSPSSRTSPCAESPTIWSTGTDAVTNDSVWATLMSLAPASSSFLTTRSFCRSNTSVPSTSYFSTMITTV